jgi:hypothetical protein
LKKGKLVGGVIKLVVGMLAGHAVESEGHQREVREVASVEVEGWLEMTERCDL